MKSIIKKLSASFTALMLVFLPALVVVPVATAQSPGPGVEGGICKGVGYTTEDGGCADEGGEEGFAGLAKRVINIFSIVVGAVSVVMIIIGGFRYIISAGDQNGVTGAKNTILYAIVGLVIVLFAQIIVRFVLTNATQ